MISDKDDGFLKHDLVAIYAYFRHTINHDSFCMRYTLPGAGLIVLLLSACATPGSLAVDQVLQKSADASRNLTSVAVQAQGTVRIQGDTSTYVLEPNIHGTLQDGGSQVHLQFDVKGMLEQSQEKHNIDASAQVTVGGPGDVYLRIETLAITPPHPLLQSEAIRQLTGTWWQLPHQGSGADVAGDLTPDPKLLRAQAQVVRVTKDYGLASIHGSEAYHYDITIDPQKLRAFLQKAADEQQQEFDDAEVTDLLERYQATGSIWIDAKTFFIHRLEWSISPKVKGDDGVTADIVIDFTRHNAADPITLPLDAQPFLAPSLSPQQGNASSSVSSSSLAPVSSISADDE
jgi:hypothetical protein